MSALKEIVSRLAWGRRLHDGLAQSIVNRATLTGMAFVLFMTLLVALASLPVIYQQLASAQAADARYQTLRLQEYFEYRLDTVFEQLQSLARNSFVVNAFVDSTGRDIYLHPQLRDFQVPLGLSGQLVVLDLNHAPIASNGSGDLSAYANHPVAREAFHKGKPSMGLDADGQTVVFAMPVFFAPVSGFVGTLVLRVPAAQLFEASSRYVNANRCFLVSVGPRVLYRPPCLAGTLSMDRNAGNTDAAPVQVLRFALAGEPIGLQLKDFDASLAAPLGKIFLVYVFLAIVCGIFALVMSKRHVQSMMRPLLELSRVAQEIAADPHSVGLANATGADEVGKLGQAFNAMLTQLRNLHGGLEQRITEATHDLLIAKEKAEAATTAKGRFLATMSHEIRTPLNVIRGMAYAMRAKGLSPTQEESLAHIDAAGFHLLGIVSDVLDLAKMDADKLNLQTAAVDLYALASSTLQMMQGTAQRKQLQLVLRMPDALPPLLGDAKRLRQGLLNYLSNALKFTETGTITLSVRIEEETNDHALVRFEVQDSGVGIGEPMLAKLFAPFEQADNSDTREHGGTGLGLVITKRLAELIGGSAGVISVEGTGSTFWFTAQLQKAAQKPAQNTAPNTLPRTTEPRRSSAHVLQHDHAAKRILLVDDDAITRRLFQTLIADLGLLVDGAENGMVAVEKAHAQNYDLIVMDMQMPHMGGVEASRRIRAVDGGKQVPIIMLTGNAFEYVQAESLDAGVNDFLAKPVEPEDLFAAMVKWLSATATRPQRLPRVCPGAAAAAQL